jgi:polyhydroxybutyrate depolymerase
METVAAKYAVDRSRVYLVGFSSGGMMAQRFAMEKTHEIAGIVPIAASIPVPLMERRIKPEVPVPVMMINGTDDSAFPWKGGKTWFAGIRVGAVSPVETTLRYWIDANGGQAGVETREALPVTVQDGTTVEKTVYRTAAGPEVALYKVNGGGHSWPGAKYPLTYLPKLLYGKTSQQFSGSEAAWNFLKNYSRDTTKTLSAQPAPL